MSARCAVVTELRPGGDEEGCEEIDRMNRPTVSAPRRGGDTRSGKDHRDADTALIRRTLPVPQWGIASADAFCATVVIDEDD